MYKPFTLLLDDICFGTIAVVINKSGKISFTAKAYKYDKFYKLNIDIQIRFCCLILRGAIIVFYGFYPFVTIANQIFGVIDKLDIIVRKVLF